MSGSIINRTADGVVVDQQVRSAGKAPVSLRRFPYPYRAAMTICSDIDQTRTTAEFLEIQQFLNTKHTTSMGEGVGLEIGNSFFFYNQNGHFSYFNGDERAQRVIADMIRAGYIDCLHSYGDLATDRAAILRALEVLYKADCKLEVWVNHSGAPSNFSRKFAYMLGDCRGDDPNSNVYHADVTLDYGIRFVWVGAVTRVIGQSPSKPLRSLFTVFDPAYPVRSSTDALKELRKNILGRWADKRYTLHRQNRLMQMAQLEDGRQVQEFMRYCNHPVSISQGATSRGLAYVISKRALAHLKAVQGFMIVYAHLGKNSDCEQVIAPETQASLRYLEHEYRTGQIYVTTTAKLLNFYHACDYLVWSHQQRGNHIRINIEYLDDPIRGQQRPIIAQLQGLTFYVPNSQNAEISIQGIEVQGIQRNPADDSGMESVTIPVTHLRFPY